jgi:DNA-binding transcriptional LysR family regulator
LPGWVHLLQAPAFTGRNQRAQQVEECSAERGLRFAIGIEVSSLESMRTYVANGCCVGLFVANPRLEEERPLRTLPMAKFPQLILGALWLGKLPPLAQSFLTEVRRRAAGLGK